MNSEEVLKLAKLSRIEISGEEAETLSHQFDSILGYVGEVKKAKASGSQDLTAESFPIKNVMRGDEAPHESGVYTEDILKQAPASKAGYIKVKKIL